MSTANCEISSIFSNIFTTMYPVVPANMMPTHDKFLSMGSSEMNIELTAEPSGWAQDLPAMWSQQQVMDWIGYHVEQNKWDASTIDLTQCEMDGQQLCQLSREDMTNMFGGLGDKLYDHLCLLREWPSSQTTDSCGSGMGEFHASSYDWDLIYDVLKNEENMHVKSEIDEDDNCCGQTFNTYDPGYYSDPISPASSESCGSEQFKTFKKTDGGPNKRRRGRPRKLNSDSRDILETKKSKHSARGTHLWEFIRDILLHPELNEGLLKWEDRSEGVFKFLRSEAVAQLWGQKKKNTSMTYEKLSRAMRYYYKREILERVDGRRLVYKFGKNSSGWRLGEKGTLGS
ncbi:ETS-related transcription factor Elf-3 isoform X2 [Bombina bombina]|uniref:ETS-related transcription factor Elf-3 isoform X2 n=1 Tax=Bombina bombina TaxID=8345 RepID=UPI00235B08D2|nr:ETS-related transcription factor Elf-3 isoform X2 [Bombina bombina]